MNAIATSGTESIVVSEGRTELRWGAVRRIATPQAGVTTLMRSAPEAMEWLVGVGVDAAGNAYAARLGYAGLTGDTGIAQPMRVSPVGGETPIPVAPGTGLNLRSVKALASDAAGILYLGGPAGLFKVPNDGQVVTMRTLDGWNEVTGIALSPNGVLYAAVVNSLGSWTTAIHRIDASGQWTQVAQIADRGTGIAVGEDGEIYAAFPDTGVVRKFAANGVISTVAGTEGHRGFVAGSLPGVLDRPRGVAIQGTNLYIAMPTAIAVIRNRP